MAPRWLTMDMVIAMHSELVVTFGGIPGIRDKGLLESALDRPKNLYAHEDRPQPPRLAAAYCAGIVNNHPFLDGNKRTGYVVAHTFIEMNGYGFSPPEAEVVTVIMSLAAGGADENGLAEWFSRYSTAK